MTSNVFASAVVFSIPLVVAVFCFGMTLLDIGKAAHPVRRKIHLQAMAAYGLFAMCWLLVVSRLIFPVFHVRSLPVFIPAAMMAYVLLFRMIRTATDPGEGPRFPQAHFVAPAVMFAALVALWLALPSEHIAEVVHNAGSHSLDAYTVTAYIITGICIAYGIVYPVMSLVRIVRFRRARKAKSPHDKVLTRLFWAILLDMVMVPVPIFGMLLGMEPFIHGGYLWLIAVLPSRVVYIISCFDLLSGNYMVLEGEKPRSSSQTPPASRLERERVDRYIETKKPWLNPAFRITDMAEDLYSNRAYISAFINSEYGMNFSRFVNSFRLEEVRRLKAEARRMKQRVPMLQLILNAGFSSYRSYLRAKEAAGNGKGEAADEW